MKKVISYILLISMILSLPACHMFEKRDIATQPNDTRVISYDKQQAPSQVVKTENYWVLLISEYWGTNYRISVSENPEELNIVYTADNVIIWYIEANDDYIVWCEETVNSHDYKCYSIQEDTVELLFSANIEEGYQPQNIGIYKNKIYYPVVDHQNQTADIYCYDVETKKKSSACSLPYDDKYPVMTMNVEANYLSVASAAGILVFDVETECVAEEIKLPEEVEFVYAVSYDYINRKCALYYADQDSEDIGFINEKGEMDSHYTFGDRQYAFEDKIKCIDGYIYWIVQIEATGDVTDHYRYVEYDYINYKSCEIKRGFNLEVGEGYKYYLCFDKDGNYQKIELYER